MEILVVGTVFLASAAFVWGVLGLLFGQERLVARRLKGLTDYEISQAQDANPLLKSFHDRIITPFVGAAVALAELIGPADLLARTDERLTLAGRPGDLTARTFVALRFGGAALGAATGAFLIAFSVVAPRSGLLLLGALAAGGYAAPGIWLRTRIERRQAELRHALPDMLDMLTISVEAGLGFDAALAKYVKNSKGPLGEEFGRALQEIQAGVARRDALRRVIDRTRVRELSSFLTAMIQAEMLGTSVAHVLRSQSTEIRLRRRQHTEEEAQKLPVKQVFPVILCILPATMLVVLGPAIVMMMGLFSGQ